MLEASRLRKNAVPLLLLVMQPLRGTHPSVAGER